MKLEQLKEPFPPSDVSWRIGQAGKKQNGDVWAKVLAYIDNRNIQERLDAVVGPENWKNEYAKGPEGGVLCGLSIKVDGEWITKWDGAENSDIEAVKGGLSDAMKRAAVQWGIGRYLYELGENWAEIVTSNVPGSHYANCKVKIGGKEEFATFHWLPPRGVLPEAKKAQAIAKEHGLATGDKVPQPSAYERALQEITKAVRNHDAAYLTKISQLVEQRVREGAISESEDKMLGSEISIARRKIEAVQGEPVAA